LTGTNIFSGKTVNEMWSAISDTIHAVVEEFIPHRIFKPDSSHRKKSSMNEWQSIPKNKEEKRSLSEI